MKKLNTLILVLIAMSLQAQKYYYNGSEKIEIYLSEKSFIVFDDDKQTPYDGFEKAERYLAKKITILKNKKSGFSIKNSLESNQISPAFKLENSEDFEMFPTKTVRVKLLPNVDKQRLFEILEEDKISKIENKYGIIRIRINDINDVLNIANKIYESGIAEFSLPDFYIEKVLNQINDPLFPLQYQMNNTGQVVDGFAGINDIDSNALEAWNINLGDNVTVAIIDQGLEAHEDIGGRLLGGFTPWNDGNGQPNANNDTHGMNCAGVLAASDNNLGVRGVAPNANLLSVNIFAGAETAGDIADGITWAVNNGADVISNSWSFSNVPCGFTNAEVDAAIQNAITRGRNRRGCVVVFSSGNDLTFGGGCVDYPATNPNVVSVGAIDNQGNLYGYSRRGPELDLVAPSGLSFFWPGETNVGVRTLDRMGAAGDFAGNYRDDFDGTSAACPVVSGAAALVLSANPNLTQQDVRNILINTATDMGVNGFDNNFGFGRVNAFAAVQAAIPTSLNGPSLVCGSSNETYTLTNVSSPVTWQVSTNLQIVSSNNTNITVTPISPNLRESGFIKAITGSGLIERGVWIGKPDAYSIDINGNENYMGGSFTFQRQAGARGEFSVFSNASDVTYNFSGPNNVGWWQINKNTVEVDISFPGTHTFTAEFSNDCGTHYYFVFVTITDSFLNFRVAPNPTSDSFSIFNVNNANDRASETLSENVSYELYDLNSVLKLKGDLKNSRTVNIYTLKKGLYILKLISKTEVEYHRILID